MTQIELLIKQTEDAYKWSNTILKGTQLTAWDHIPAGIETNITWQIGHLIMGIYFNAVILTVGHRKEVFSKMPLRDYGDYFTKGSPADAVGKVAPEILMFHFEYMKSLSIEVLKSLKDEDLDQPLEPSRVPHPFAKQKYEVIDWNIKHVMWHCGQIGLLKRVLGTRHDFGLKV